MHFDIVEFEEDGSCWLFNESLNMWTGWIPGDYDVHWLAPDEFAFLYEGVVPAIRDAHTSLL